MPKDQTQFSPIRRIPLERSPLDKGIWGMVFYVMFSCKRLSIEIFFVCNKRPNQNLDYDWSSEVDPDLGWDLYADLDED